METPCFHCPDKSGSKRNQVALLQIAAIAIIAFFQV